MEELKAYLAKFDEPEEPADFDLYSATGGNINDAFDMGIAEGEQRLASRIRKLLGETVWVEFKGTCLPEPGARAGQS